MNLQQVAGHIAGSQVGRRGGQLHRRCTGPSACWYKHRRVYNGPAGRKIEVQSTTTKNLPCSGIRFSQGNQVFNCLIVPDSCHCNLVPWLVLFE